MFAGGGGIRVDSPMKIAIIGGSAQGTPALWSYLVNDARLQGIHVVLMGRECGRLQTVARACYLLGRPPGNELSAVSFDRNGWSSLTGADVILIQIRNGGYAARAFDETFPLRYDVCGDEGLGPGGLSAAIRNWKVVGPALENIQRFAPDAMVLMMSSPVGLLVRAAKRTFPQLNIAGICELPWTTLRDACTAAALDPTEVQFDYFGINHLGWLYGLQQGSRPVAAE